MKLTPKQLILFSIPIIMAVIIVARAYQHRNIPASTAAILSVTPSHAQTATVTAAPTSAPRLSLPTTPKELIPYRKKDKWGYANSKKEMVIKPQYSFAYPFHGDLAAVKDATGKIAFINRNGLNITPFKYSSIEYLTNGSTIVQATVESSDYAHGLIDRFGNENILPQYYELQPQSDGTYIAQKKESKGVVDNKGVAIVPFEKYRNIQKVDDGWAVILASNNQYGYIDSNKALTTYQTPAIDYHLDFADGLMAVQQWEEGLYGYINKTGQLVIPFRYAYARSFHDGIAVVETSRDSNKTDSIYIDTEGNEIYRLTHNASMYSAGYSEQRLFPVCNKGSEGNNGCGFIDAHGQVLIPLAYDGGAKYSALDYHGRQYIALEKHTDDYTLISTDVYDAQGNLLYSAKNTDIHLLDDHYAEICSSGLCGLADTSGNIVVQQKYDSFEPESLTAPDQHNTLPDIFTLKYTLVCITRGDKRAGGSCNTIAGGKVGYIDAQGTEYWED